MHKYILVCVFFIANLFCATAQELPSEAQLHTLSYTSEFDQTERDFYLYLPKGYTTENDKKWPVLLFLHGNGERGNGKNELPFTLAHGPLYEAWVQKRDLPFIIIQPQLHMYGFDSIPNSYFNTRKLEDYPKRLKKGIPKRNPKSQQNFDMQGSLSNTEFPYKSYGPPMGWETVENDLMYMINSVSKNYKTDSTRIYLSGLSYGGFGSWYLASKHPKTFAAINPIVGWGHPDLMASISKNNIPVWCFAGGRDTVIPVEYFYPGLNTLENLGDSEVRFTIEADMGHDTWTRVYAGEDIYNWFLQHIKE